MDSAVSVELFVEILNRYVYYFDQQNEQVSFHSHSAIHTSTVLTILTGHGQVPQRPYRAHPLERAEQRRELNAGNTEAPFPEDAGCHFGERV